MARGGDSTVYMVGDDSGKKKKDKPVLCDPLLPCAALPSAARR